MELLFITPGKLPVPASRGGAVENLIEKLISNDELKKKYNVSVITSYDEKSLKLSKSISNVNFIFIETSSIIYKVKRFIRYLINRINFLYIGNEYIYQVNKYLLKHHMHYDIIIIENSPQYALCLNKCLYNRIFLHLHNDFLNIDTDKSKKIVNKYDKIFCVSDFLKKRVEQIDSNFKKVFILYNGVDLKIFNNNLSHDEIQKIKNKYLLDGKFCFVYSGRIVSEKGIKELIICFNKLKKYYKNIKLIICGDNKNYFAKKLKIISDIDILFLGYQSAQNLAKIYNVCDIGVVPTKINEGFGLTVIENMACGNPVIATDLGGLPELIDKKTGIIFKSKNIKISLYNALKEALERKFVLGDIIKNAKKYDINKYCDNFIDLIDDGEGK